MPKNLNQVHLGPRGWGEVHRDALIAFQPCLDVGVFVRGVVVGHDVQPDGGWALDTSLRKAVNVVWVCRWQQASVFLPVATPRAANRQLVP